MKNSEKSENLQKKILYFIKLLAFDSDFLRGHSGIHLAKGAILAAIRQAQL